MSDATLEGRNLLLERSAGSAGARRRASPKVPRGRADGGTARRPERRASSRTPRGAADVARPDGAAGRFGGRRGSVGGARPGTRRPRPCGASGGRRGDGRGVRGVRGDGAAGRRGRRGASGGVGEIRARRAGGLGGGSPAASVAAALASVAGRADRGGCVRSLLGSAGAAEVRGRPAAERLRRGTLRVAARLLRGEGEAGRRRRSRAAKRSSVV